MESPNIMPAPLLNPPCSMFAPSLRALLSLILILTSGVASAQAVRVVAKVNGDAITDFSSDIRVGLALGRAVAQRVGENRTMAHAESLPSAVDTPPKVCRQVVTGPRDH